MRRIRSRLLLSMVTLISAFLVLEAGLRLYARWINALTVVQLDPQLGWRLIPQARRHVDSETEPYDIAINSAGWRDGEFSTEKPRGVYRILLLGDSFLFATGGVDYGLRYSEILEQRLPSLEALNFGVPGFDLAQEYLLLEREGLNYDPDLVVVCLYWNDDLESFLGYHPKMAHAKPCLRREGGELVIRPPAHSLFARAVESSAAISWVERRLATLTAKRDALPERDIPDEERAFCFRQIFRRFVQGSLLEGADLAVTYLPHPWDANAQPNLMQVSVRDSAKELGFVWVDLTPRLGPGNAKEPYFFAVNGHLNRRGHEVVAAELQAMIKSLPSWSRFQSQTANSGLDVQPKAYGVVSTSQP
ncbi:MAG: SGNH/GDSL hydrolase family protein [Pirellulales bacterium]|nr:SGNH/GDSL hydrolase family protein [Pirellulales bacterium]